MQKHISHAERSGIRVVLITLDAHAASAADRARNMLADDIPGLEFSFHAASDWASDPNALADARADIADGDIIIANMLFMEDHVNAVIDDLRARRDTCDAMVGCMSAAEVIKLTRLGKFDMSKEAKGPLALLKRLRGGGGKKGGAAKSSGTGQMKMLRRIPKLLKYIPGTAQDVRAYFLTMQYWFAGSDENIANLVRFLVSRYATGARAELSRRVVARDPVNYPDVGLYHPRLAGGVSEKKRDLDAIHLGTEARGRVGVLIMRSYVLSGDTGHYDGVIAALEARGLDVVPAFASGLDGRPAIDAYFRDAKTGETQVDAVLSLTGFSLVGGPAYNDTSAAEASLAQLDVPYLSAHALEFQSLEEWQSSERGLLPLESTIMVALPELDGATTPTVFGGRTQAKRTPCNGRAGPRGASEARQGGRDMVVCEERAERLAGRVAELVRLRRSQVSERKVAITLFNFPPNAGATGTAAFLAVMPSLFNTLQRMARDGYDVGELPPTVDALRDALLGGNADRYGTDANVHAHIPAEDHVAREEYLAEIEEQWGAAPGRQLTNGSDIFVLGRQFGNVLIGVQPGFGYEGDPMRLLFEKGFAPTHAFSAYYRYLREDFGANAVLHFGTHGALEFMPGKQTGLTGACWPDRLIRDLPNLYLYAANNPSEGTIAKRRSGATLISYMTPAVTEAGLYKGLLDLKSALDRWRGLEPDASGKEREDTARAIAAQAEALDLVSGEPAWADGAGHAADDAIATLGRDLHEMECALIPHGMHVVGETPNNEARVDMLSAVAEASFGIRPVRDAVDRLVTAATPAALVKSMATDPEAAELDQAQWQALADLDRNLCEDHELPALMRALDGRFIRPVAGGDLLRTPETVPTGRNVHGFDPFRIPSAFAVADGAQQAARLLDRHLNDGNDLPRSIAVVLWGTDNLKSEGGPIAQVLALMGAKPRFDGYGRLSGADLIPLEELGRPRIDVVITLSGIFRDLLPLQIKMLAEAALKAAQADEPEAMNFIRANALAFQTAHDCDLETAALRVFSNADGAYGANVNQLIDSGAWGEENELADAYEARKCFAYGVNGLPQRKPELLQSALSGVEMAYQNLESVELGVTTIDHYFDTLGGIGRAVKRARGSEAAVYIGDQTRGKGQVRTLSEQVALETRTRALNPKWTEGMLKHGHEGVRQIEAHVTNTMGWSATTGGVAPWVYQKLAETYVLDDAMRQRLADLNPKASARMASRLIEAHERDYWQPDPETMDALMRAGEELEDRLEGLIPETVAASAA